MLAVESGWSASRQTTVSGSPNRFSNSKRDLQTLFEKTAAKLDIRYKMIHPYTPRHNGKVVRSHREDRKRSYSCHTFHSLDDFVKQLALLNRRSNNFPMRPLPGFPLSSSLSNLFDKPAESLTNPQQRVVLQVEINS